MSTLKDTDGNEWAPFVNEFQQRQLRCIAGDRLGEVIHDPRWAMARAPATRSAAATLCSRRATPG